MNSRALTVMLTGLFLGGLVIATPSHAQDEKNADFHFGRHLVEFNAPGAATESTTACAPFCGTFAYANNDLGLVVGYYTDANVVPHGFLRFPDGRIIPFDAPGAGLGHGLNQGTAAYSVNDFGVIAGQFQDPNYLYHGFVRRPDGSFTTFDANGAGTGVNQGTLAFDINLEGATAGIYIDGSGIYHGFVRSPRGESTTSIDPPNSVFTYVCEETCLNVRGAITGFYVDSNGQHGFLREPDGTITPIDAPGAVEGTTAASLNAEGTITGYLLDSNGTGHGFVRYCSGSFITFEDPEAGSVAGQGTYPFSINLVGAVTGQYTDASNVNYGFERSADGKFTSFDAPNAAPGQSAGTRPSTNNLEGSVTGWWIDANNLNHGFVWTW